MQKQWIFFFYLRIQQNFLFPLETKNRKKKKKEDESKLAYHKPVTQGRNINRFCLLSKYKMRKGFGTEWRHIRKRLSTGTKTVLTFRHHCLIKIKQPWMYGLLLAIIYWIQIPKWLSQLYIQGKFQKAGWMEHSQQRRKQAKGENKCKTHADSAFYPMEI